MELFDERLGTFFSHGLHTLPELEVVADPEEMVNQVDARGVTSTPSSFSTASM